MLIAFFFQFSTTWSKKATEDTKGYMSIMGKLNASIIEYVRGMQVVKIFNRSSIALENLKKQIFGFRDFSNTITSTYAVTYLGFYNMLSAALLFIIPAAIYFLLKAPSYTGYISTVLIFLVLGGGIFFPMLKLMWMTNMLRQNSIGVDLMDGILKKEEITDPIQPQTPRDASIEFVNVSFAYDKTEVLNNVSFTARPGTVTALVGVSGAGKSTLLNAIDPRLSLDTGDISQKLGRGRHTTRHVELYELPSGGFVADTPGFSAVDLEKFQIILKDELAGCFREMRQYEGKCRFRGCSHTKEAGCAVLEAVKNGEISQSRHQSYLNLYELAKNIKEWEIGR